VRRRYDGTQEVQEEFVDGTWRQIGAGPRFAPPAPERPAKLPPPKTGWRYKLDGSGEQEMIPGGPEDTKQKASLAQARMRVGGIVQNLDKLSTAMQELHDDPGLARITGTVAGRTPNLTNAATGAQAKLDSISAQNFVSALQAMREASKTGGAVGNVSDREGDKLERVLAALAQSQGTADFQSQLKKAQNQLRISKELIRNAYKEQFGEDFQMPAGTDITQPGGSGQAGGPFSDPEKERRYQEWKAGQKK
jgi:hypothetical protein